MKVRYALFIVLVNLDEGQRKGRVVFVCVCEGVFRMMGNEDELYLRGHKERKGERGPLGLGTDQRGTEL